MKSGGLFCLKVIFLLLVFGVVHPKETTKGATVKTTPFDSNEKVNGIQTGASTPHNLRSTDFSPNPKTLPVVRGDSPEPHPPKKYTSDSHRGQSRIDDKNYCEYSQDDVECSDVGGDCLVCDFDAVKNTCIYGENVTIRCNATDQVTCKGKREFQKQIVCQYCYQTPTWQQRCNGISLCYTMDKQNGRSSIGSPRQVFPANCTVAPKVLCFGSRRFNRMMPCNWKNGYRWSTTFILSITLGGFGADRFYLGRWQEGIGKLFSFGGLGLWTIVDIILIGVRYLGPADGSLYVD